MADMVFSMVDAQGVHFLVTRADESHKPAFQKHAAWWSRYAKTAEYRARVDPFRWPVFPVKLHIEPCAIDT